MASISLRDAAVVFSLTNSRDYNLKRTFVDLVTMKRQPARRIEALRGITLEIAEGSRVGLIGPNGAGKSTLLSLMAGILAPTTGTVYVEGRVLALLGGAGAGLELEASGLDNIVNLGVQLGESASAMRARIDEVVDFSGLDTRIGDPVYTYSSGMQARLRFSTLTSLSPDVLLLDEGLGTADAAFAHKAQARLETFVSSVGIVILASHGDDLLREICSDGLWLQGGQVVQRGVIDRVLSEYHSDTSVLAPSQAGGVM
jgi:ABC-2 type transport system ATP-binding protein